MAWQMPWKKNDLLLGEPEKINKKDRGKSTQAPPLSSSSYSCKISHWIPWDYRLQTKCLIPFPTNCMFRISSHSFVRTHILSIGFLRTKGRQQLIGYMMSTCYEEDATDHLFLALLVASWYVETRHNSLWFILEMFPINILTWCKPNEWG